MGRPAGEGNPPVEMGHVDQALIESVRHHSSDARLLSAEELREHKQVTSVAALVDTLINDRSENVRVAAAQSLGEIGMGMARWINMMELS